MKRKKKVKVKMYELNKKTISTLIVTILMLSMALAAMPMAVAADGLTVKLSKIPLTATHRAIDLVAKGTSTATWATAPGNGRGVYSVKLVSSGGANEAKAMVYPKSGTTLSNLDVATLAFDYWLTSGLGSTVPELELRFLAPDCIDADDETSTDRGHADITFSPVPGAATPDTWLITTGLSGSSTVVCFGNKPLTGADLFAGGKTGTFNEVKAAILALNSAYGSWELTRVAVQVGWAVAITGYVDNVKVGTTISALEPSGNVGDKVTVSGTSATLGGLIQVYWDSPRAWDGTAGLLAEKYAVGNSYSVEITIPEGKSGTHYIVVQDGIQTGSAIFVMEPEIALTPKAGLEGDVITVKGTGFGKEVTVTAKYTITGTIATVDLTLSPSGLKTSALGSFTATFAIPTDAITGPITATTGTVSATASLTVGTSITLTPPKGIAGTTVTVSGRGFEESSTVDVTWTVTPGYDLLLVDDYDTDSNGAFTTTFTVPAVNTGKDYTVTAKDTEDPTVYATADFTMTGATAITLSPKSGLPGIDVTVTGVWFTKSKTVTVYFDATSVGTVTASSIISYGFTKVITIPVAATFGAHTIKAMDSEGVYATATFTVSERVIVIETRSTTYMPGDTLSFDIHSTVEFKTASTIVIKIYDPDDYLFWSVIWTPVEDVATDTWVVPYSAQTASGFHLTLPSDAMAGLWKWNATYYLTDVVTKIVKPSSFTVKAATASVIDEKITALEESINLLGVQILAAQTAAQAAQTAATTAGTKATAAETAAKAAQAAAEAAGTKATAAETAAKAALTAAQAAMTAAQAATTAAQASTTAANAAKASADAAKAATDSLTTLVYVAIGASAIAALAAVFAVMQISKKIA